jgi:hypothetical protein
MKILKIMLSITLIIEVINCMERTHNKVSIADLEKSHTLQALFNAAKPQGLEYLHHKQRLLSKSEAVLLLNNTCVFDYVEGRALKVNLCGDTFNSELFNKHNGEKAAEKAITTLRK